MEHLEFVEKLLGLGVSISSTNVAGREKRIEISRPFAEKDVVVIKDFKLSYENPKTDYIFNHSPLKDLIESAIDMGEWKHSWHNEIIPQNYPKFLDIIQEKIIDRAKEIDVLLAVYFQINYEKERAKPPEK